MNSYIQSFMSMTFFIFDKISNPIVFIPISVLFFCFGFFVFRQLLRLFR